MLKYLSLTVLVIGLGLLSRKCSFALPEIVNTYLGDSLWAMMVYFGTRIITSKKSVWITGSISLTFCYLIECSQLYHAAWIDAIRHTALGALVLGVGFLWSDITAYTMGVCLAIVVDYFIVTKSPAHYMKSKEEA